MMNGRELRIPTSFGHLAAVEWGPSDGQRIVALHGWQDNALTFQPLVQLLSPNLRIVALDFSGHGLSSHLGPGANYNGFHYICDIIRLVSWLKWDTFSIIGHSMGGIVAIKFITMFPSKVQNVITLDVLYPGANLQILEQLPVSRLAELYVKLDEREMSNRQRAVSWEEAVQEFGDTRVNLSKNKLELLLGRAVKPAKTRTGDQPSYYFTRDHRVKLANCLEYTVSSIAQTMKRLPDFYTGTWLAIINENSWYTPAVDKMDDQLKDEHTRNMKSFRVIYVKDVNTHFFHLECPEKIAPYINEVFLSINSKL